MSDTDLREAYGSDLHAIEGPRQREGLTDTPLSETVPHLLWCRDHEKVEWVTS